MMHDGNNTVAQAANVKRLEAERVAACMKFKPGDKVWARIDEVAPLAAVVVRMETTRFYGNLVVIEIDGVERRIVAGRFTRRK